MTQDTGNEAPLAEQVLVMEMAGLRSDRVRTVVRHGDGWLASVYIAPEDLEP